MLVEQIKADMTAAMKSGEVLRLSVLRMLVSEMNYKQIDAQRELTDEDVVVVLQKEAKKRREAIESYQKAGRTDQAEKEQEELEILQVYLPKMMGEEEIREEIKKIEEIKELNDFGQIMRIVAPKFKGRADGALVAKIVNEKIK